MESSSRSRGTELGVWEEQPGGQFSLSYTGKRESMRRRGWRQDRVLWKHWNFTLRMGLCPSLATYSSVTLGKQF